MEPTMHTKNMGGCGVWIELHIVAGSIPMIIGIREKVLDLEGMMCIDP
jgi:hypothetical protein